MRCRALQVRLERRDVEQGLRDGEVRAGLDLECEALELTVAGETVVTPNGVKILGPRNLASDLARHASQMYARNLLNFLLQSDGKDTTTETTTEGINSALADELPSDVKALPSAEASDADTYTVTQETADEYGLKEIGDLKKIGGTVKIAANPEFATAAYGPEGLKEKYGVTGEVSAQNDSGGPLTIKAIQDGDAQVADIYSASASIKTEKLVTLEDPEHLVPANNVVPIVSKDLDSKAADAIEKVNDLLTTEALIELNRQNSVEQKSAASVAKAFLEDNDLL